MVELRVGSSPDKSLVRIYAGSQRVCVSGFAEDHDETEGTDEAVLHVYILIGRIAGGNDT